MAKPLNAINQLINWYEKFKPESGQRIDVNLAPRDLAKKLGVPCAKQQVEFPYRGRTLVAIGGRDSEPHL
jgi:hypothetical protein